MAQQKAHAFGDRRMRAFVDSVFDAFFDWNIATGYNEWSGQMDVLLRLEPGSMPRTFETWLERLHPADRERVHRENLRVAAQGGVYEGEYRLRRGDDTYILGPRCGVVIGDDDGVSRHMVGAIRDITAEREAERAQREAADLYHTLSHQRSTPPSTSPRVAASWTPTTPALPSSRSPRSTCCGRTSARCGRTTRCRARCRRC